MVERPSSIVEDKGPGLDGDQGPPILSVSEISAMVKRTVEETFARVRVPATNGVALYFWLRLGYRPLASRSWPAPAGAQAGTWMVRELGSHR